MAPARLEDVMKLAVKTPQPPMTGALRLKTKFELPPGDQDVVDKLRLDGDFVIAGGRFTDPDVERKINEMSVRATGKTGDGGATPKVASDFSGRFALGNGVLTLQRLTFNIPGAVVELKGQYVLQRETLAFLGHLVMDAKVSEATTGWKSVLLRMVDPLFRKNGQTVIPLKIGGTRSAPSFGMDVGRVFKQRKAANPAVKGSVLARGLPGKVVVIRHMRFEAAIRSVLGIARDKLVVPTVDREVEGVARVLVNQLEVGIRHRQLPKLQPSAEPVDMVW
jgi:hypothetical protein